MARIRRHKRTPHMPCKSHSLESTGRSRFRRVEKGEEVNSNRAGVTPECPYLCPVCGERYKIRGEFFTHLRTYVSVGGRRRQRQLDEGPSEPPHLSECVADSWYQPQLDLQHGPQPQPPEPNLEFQPYPMPHPHPEGGLTTRPFFLEPRAPPAFQDFLNQTNGRRANSGPRTPRVDLTLRLGLTARRGRPRRRLLPLSPIGPIRRFLWFKEYVNKFRLAGRNVGAILNVAVQMPNSFPTLTDEELELKLGI